MKIQIFLCCTSKSQTLYSLFFAVTKLPSTVEMCSPGSPYTSLLKRNEGWCYSAGSGFSNGNVNRNGLALLRRKMSSLWFSGEHPRQKRGNLIDTQNLLTDPSPNPVYCSLSVFPTFFFTPVNTVQMHQFISRQCAFVVHPPSISNVLALDTQCPVSQVTAHTYFKTHLF